MRKVYTPPTFSGGRLKVYAGALLLTLAVFLVLPLTQLLSEPKKAETVAKVDGVMEPPPPPPPELEKPPPPEDAKEPPPQPEMPRESQNLSLDQLMGDVASGTGGLLDSLKPDLADAAGAADQAGIFDVSELDKQPGLLAPVYPKYPPALKKSGVPGTVVVVFLLNEQGQVEDPKIESSTRTEFERPALDAVRKWKFTPGTREGRPVRTYMRVPIAFRLSS